MTTRSIISIVTVYLFLNQPLMVAAQSPLQIVNDPNLNCVEEKNKNGSVLSEGCYILQDDKTWAKHGTWLHYNDEQILIDSINYANGLLVGTRNTYNAKGELIEQIKYGISSFPRSIKHTEFLNKGASREITTTYKQVKKDSVIKHGVLISKWKNGNLKDSVVFENGIKKFWAGFYKTGELSFTSEFGENPKKGSPIKTTEFNKDGTIRSTRTEYAGYDVSLF